jgi:hypothetical protein
MRFALDTAARNALRMDRVFGESRTHLTFPKSWLDPEEV